MFGKGGLRKGPAILPALISLVSLSRTISGRAMALFKLGGSKTRLSPWKCTRKPKLKPGISRLFKAKGSHARVPQVDRL